MSQRGRVFRTFVLALAGSVLVFLSVGLLLADRWDVDSSRLVTAPAERVAPLLRDFAAWQEWSGMTVELGAGMTRVIDGEPGTVGHRVTWSGAQGDAILRLSDVAPGRIGYEFLTRRADAAEASRVARGSIAWRADGDGTLVQWHDEAELDTLVERWIVWFGALQERVRQIQGTSLAGLQRALDGAAPK